MELSGIVTVGWQWLKQAVNASKALSGNVEAEMSPEFYESKMETMKFFYKYELPKTMSLADSLMNTEWLTIKKEKEILR